MPVLVTQLCFWLLCGCICTCMCVGLFFVFFLLNNELVCFQLLHPCVLKRPQSAGLILSLCVHAAYVWYFSDSHCASQLPDWLLRFGVQSKRQYTFRPHVEILEGW